MSFGAALRLLRIDAGMSLSDLARHLGVSPAYLSRVEHGHDAVPTPDRVVAIAEALAVPPLVLLEIAQGAGAAIASYLERVPEASTLFVEMARRELGAAEIARIKAYIDREMPVRGAAKRPARLGEHLDAKRVLVQVVCHDLDDVISLAAARLADDPDDARALMRLLAEREAEMPSFVGRGVVVPHAIVPGATAIAALVTLAKPLRAATPDGEPVRLAVVLVTPATGRRHVHLMAHIARLATRGVADMLADARSAERALGRLEALDVS
jgi:PTS system nitrogen regulatory IIA component